MMNRIFKRPMFRMGGRSDDGIMSIRRGYQEGDHLLQNQNINLVGNTCCKRIRRFCSSYGPNDHLQPLADLQEEQQCL